MNGQRNIQRIHKALGRQVGAETEKQGLTEEQLFEELEQTRQEVFAERYPDLAAGRKAEEDYKDGDASWSGADTP